MGSDDELLECWPQLASAKVDLEDAVGRFSLLTGGQVPWQILAVQVLVIFLHLLLQCVDFLSFVFFLKRKQQSQVSPQIAASFTLPPSPGLPVNYSGQNWLSRWRSNTVTLLIFAKKSLLLHVENQHTHLYPKMVTHSSCCCLEQQLCRTVL